MDEGPLQRLAEQLVSWKRCCSGPRAPEQLQFVAESTGLGSAVPALCVRPCSAQPAAHAPLRAQEAAAAGAQLVVLPEMWNCPYSNDSFPSYAEDVDAGASPSADALAAAAADNGVTLVGGSIPERSAGRLYNTCLVYSSRGRLLAKHRKARRSASCLMACAGFMYTRKAGRFTLRRMQMRRTCLSLPPA